jgi:hypothetical protein
MWMAAINAEEVAEWVWAANAIFAEAGIRFRYDPETDFTTADSTLLNTMTSEELSELGYSFGDAVASRYPGRLVVFFRHGALGGEPVDGFSSPYLNFVAMPGFDQILCGYHYRSMLAHEIGHYLGLDHTFSETFQSLEAAEDYFVRYGRTATVFDGDGIEDTPPDPYVESTVCDRRGWVILDGVSLPLPLDNVMSYYPNPTGLSERQIEGARWMLGLRQEHGMAVPVNEGAPFSVEAENLEIRRIERGTTEEDWRLPYWGFAWNGGDHLAVHAEPDCELDLVFHVARTGRYQVDLYMGYGPDYGQVQIGVDGQTRSEPFDAYGHWMAASGPIELGELELGAGEHTLNLEVVGRNEASGGYSFGIDCLSVVPLD